MLPFLRSGDLALICPVAERPPATGDVVAVRTLSGAGLLVHRIVALSDQEIVVQGDNCCAADGTFALEDIVGVITRVERNGRSVWYGAGRLGRPVAFAVRHGLVWRFNRAYLGMRRHAGRALKFLGADSRLPAQKGDDGNE